MTNLCTIDWGGVVKVLSAMLTPTIAVITVYIAWQQHKTTKNQVRLGFLDKRLKVFDEVVEFVRIVLSKDGKVELSDLNKFWSEAGQRSIYFGPDITEYVTQLHSNAVDLRKMRYAPHDQIDKQTAVENWFVLQFRNEAADNFPKYLTVKGID
jgi:hypothetical protein